MDTSKIIKGVVGGGKYTTTAPIIKEDYGLYLKIEGLNLPATYEVDFSNDEFNGSAVTMIGNADGVLIPHQFIDTGRDVFAFLYHVGEDFGRTIYKFKIPNKVRPDRTDEQPAPEEQSVIDQTISALNDAVAQTAQDKADADVSAQNAYTYALSANGASDTALQSAELAQTFANNASASEQGCARAVLDAASAAAIARTRADEASGYAQTASEKADAITGLTATAQTLPSGSSATASYNPETGVMSFGIPKGKDGTDGDDGYSPTASVTKSGKTATITITDKNGTTSAQVEDGTDGTDGISPTVAITPITGGHRITITDADGEHSADVMDGVCSVDDVQINGQSIVTDGVANVPIANNNKLGVIMPGSGLGINGTTGAISVSAATNDIIKNGTDRYIYIDAKRAYAASFYGLAKSAGDTTQSQSSNAVGTYTEEAKSAISEMLGGSVTVSGATPTIVAKSGIRYVCGEVATLDFTPSATGICDVVFTSGATATVLTVPNTIKWANGFDPTALDANTTYEINIMDGLGVAVGWT